MSKILQLLNVAGDDGSAKNIARIVLLGVGCAAGIAATTYFSYQVYNHVLKRPYRPAIQGSAGEGPTITDVTSDPMTIAMQLKEEGNKMFKAKKFEEAKQFYSQAIEKCPVTEEKNMAIFYQNRAAANDALKAWTDVIADCDEAISRDDRYQKAYTRRGKAKLALKQYSDALQDASIGFHLQEKKTKQNQEVFEQALDAKCQDDTTTYMEGRDPVLIGDECVRSYVTNFPNDPVLKNIQSLATPAEGQQRTPFQQACSNLVSKDYNDIIPHLNTELENESSPYIKESLLLRATFLTLAGCPGKAEKDLDNLLNMEIDARLRSTALMRRGLIHIARMDSKHGLGDMIKASEADPTNGDVFHHRGQIALLMQDFTQCQQDTKRALELQESEESNPNILLQKYMCDLQLAQMQQNMQELEAIMRRMEKLCTNHPQDGECWCLYAQALIFFSQFSEAEDVYVKAVAKCADNPRIYIQRAAMMMQWKKDVKKALEYLQKANEIDPTCEAVYENLGILYLQENKADEALEAFQKQLTYSRTAMDCKNTMVMIESIKAARLVKERFGLIPGNLMNFGGPGLMGQPF